MEFRLLYSGELFASSRNDTRAQHKHGLRRQFHPQLRRLWDVNKNLRQLAIHAGLRVAGLSTDSLLPKIRNGEAEPSWVNAGITALGNIWSRAGYQFIPLITPHVAVRCSLDVLLLRPEEDRFIFERGDIDGQHHRRHRTSILPRNRGRLKDDCCSDRPVQSALRTLDTPYAQSQCASPRRV